MVEPKLKSSIWVTAQVKMCDKNSIPIFVLKKGDPDAGSILLKINRSDNDFTINKDLVLKYFEYLKDSNFDKYDLFAQYFTKFYHFCFELNPKTMIKDAIKFEVT